MTKFSLTAISIHSIIQLIHSIVLLLLQALKNKAILIYISTAGVNTNRTKKTLNLDVARG